MKFKFLKNIFFQKIARSIFRVFLVVFVILFIMEYIEPGFVTNWLDPTWILIVVILSAIVY